MTPREIQAYVETKGVSCHYDEMCDTFFGISMPTYDFNDADRCYCLGGVKTHPTVANRTPKTDRVYLPLVENVNEKVIDDLFAKAEGEILNAVLAVRSPLIVALGLFVKVP
jgi:hypothetical protein